MFSVINIFLIFYIFNIVHSLTAEKKIDCLLEGTDLIDVSKRNKDSLQKVVDSFCYITGTYTVDKLQYGEASHF